MRKAMVGVTLALLVVAVLAAVYTADSGRHRTGTSTTEALSPFEYTTVVTNSTTSTSLNGTVTIMYNIYSTSTMTKTWLPGQPIPISGVETAKVMIGGTPTYIAVDPSAGRIYATLSDRLTVINASSHSVIARVVLPAPIRGGMAIDNRTGIVYVLVSDGIVKLIATTDKIAGELPLPRAAGSLAYNPKTHVIYSSQEKDGGYLVGLDVRTGSIVANISLGYSLWALDVAVNAATDTVYASGCDSFSLSCDAVVSIVDGKSDTLVDAVHLNSSGIGFLRLDTRTNVVYATGDGLVAFNGTNGKVIYHVYPQQCGELGSLALITPSGQIIVQLNDYLMVYDGATGILVNMYSLPSTPELGPQLVAFNSSTGELYVAVNGELVAFRNVATTGNLNTSSVGSIQDCPRP